MFKIFEQIITRIDILCESSPLQIHMQYQSLFGPIGSKKPFVANYMWKRLSRLLNCSWRGSFYSSPASREFCSLLITIWTQIRHDKMSCLIWIQTVWHSDDISGFFFQKVYLKKKSADDKKQNMKNYPVGKGLKHDI